MDIEMAGHGGDVGFEMGSGSSSGGYGGGMHLGWEDLSVVLPNFGKGPTKKLLRGLSGYAVPGHLLAIMGPSGSGKSTLLDSLAGRLSGKAIMTGKVHLNGRKRHDYGDVAYVTQEDVLLGTLTVRETLTYSAKLRLPTTMTNEDVIAIVEGTIMEMGLYDCADRLIGNWHLRGVSGGEKRRVSIALEVLIRPLLLFLDEPTSGLDTASAFFVTHTLKNVACDGRTVISSVHQPSSEVFELFDDLFLLAGGECVYFGEAKMAAEFFAEVGFPCPRKRSPPDHFMRCINSDFDGVTSTMIGSPKYDPREPGRSSDPLENMAASEVKAKLVEKYRWSDYAQKAKAKMKEISILQGLVVEESRQRSKPGWWVQLWTLTGRSSVNMSRDIGYYWLRLGFYIVLSLGVGTLYFDVGTTYSAITARVACDGFVAGFMTLMSIGGFPSFIEEMKVFHRERLNGHYGVTVYIISNFLSSFPFLVAISICTGTITFYMAKLRTEFSHYVFFILNILASIDVIESGMMVIASLVPNFLVGIISGAGFIGIMMMAAGFFRLLPDLPKPFWRYPISYLSYASWAVQGTYKNDLLGLEFDPLVPGHPKLKGEDLVKDMFGIPMDHSKWWDLTALIVIVTFYRMLFILILKFKERASPMFRTLRARRALHHLSKRASFRKGPSFPSLRHNPLPSLSSQEGLNSPMQ